METLADQTLTHWHVASVDMLSLSIVVLFVGMYLNRKVRVLRENFIPPAVTGGLIFSVGATLMYFAFDIELEFDLWLRDLFLLVFFTTVGLSARLRLLVAGGKALAKLIAVAAVFLVLQDLTGVGLAMLVDVAPGYGLMGGSISLAGGHGTAIAWGKEAEAAGLVGAEAIGISFATFGLIAGGLLGGPVAKRLIRKHGLKPSARAEKTVTDSNDATPPHAEDRLFNVLRTLLYLAVCISAGNGVNRFLFSEGVLLPGFLVAMLFGILLTNVFSEIGRPMDVTIVDRFGEISLNLFLAMSMMSMQLWLLADSANLIVFLLIAQVVVMTLYAGVIVFRVMGADYDASVISAGFVGLGLGATPVAIANVDSVAKRFGTSVKALIVIPLTGAFFIDVMNAAVIKFFVEIITRWLT